jgi:hypothetical protein
MLSISGVGFWGQSYSCLFKRGAQRATASATRVDSGRITCTVPSWNSARGKVQLILVKEEHGPIPFQGPDPAAEMFEYLAEWHPLTSNPSEGPADGGTVVAFSTSGFTAGWGWYTCVFRRPHGAHSFPANCISPMSRSLVVPAVSDIACAAGPTGQDTSHENVSSALWQQISVPAQANGSHVTCTSPQWGSSYAAALEGSQSVAPVFIVLFDGDYELPIPAHSNGSDSAGSPAYCNTRQTGILFNFSPLWTQVLGF